MWWLYYPISTKTRALLTRVLCWISLGRRVIAIVASVAVVVYLLAGMPRLEALIAIAFAHPYFVLAVVTPLYLAEYVQLYWRRCDRCARRLFSEPFAFAAVGAPSPPTGVSDREIGPVDYRAKRIWNSYRLGAEVDMALSGQLRCMRCGHVDGEKLENSLRQEV